MRRTGTSAAASPGGHRAARREEGCWADLLVMSLLHMRIVSPAGISEGVQAILRDQRGATNLVVLAGVSHDPAGDLIQADVARECVQDIVSDLRELGVDESGSISWFAVDTAIGAGMRRAERDVPGDGTDAIIWD